MVALLLVALALGMSNLAAAIGIGISGLGGAIRVRVAIVFGVFEAGMPLLGLVLGRGAADRIGHGAQWLGGTVLILVGGYGAFRAWRNPGNEESGREWRLGRVVLSGFALSIDNLAAGFALGAFHVNIGVAAAVIGAVSVGMSLAGLELGARLGSVIGTRSEVIAEMVLVGVGAAIAAGVM